MKKVSIIVPVYNAEKYLAYCIESLLNQTYSNIEIILVDDGSKDASLKICYQYAKIDDRITVLSIENTGVSTARNIGIETASGDYITFVDSDDWVELNMIEFVLEKAIKNDADIIIWSYFKNYLHKEKPLSMLPGGSQSFTTKKKLLYLKSIYQFYGEEGLNDTVAAGITWCKLYKSELIKYNNIKFNKDLIRSQDSIFSLEAFKKAGNIQYYDEKLYHYRINNSSVSFEKRYIPNTIKPFNLLLNEMINFSNEFTNKEDFIEVINARTIQVLLWHLDHKYFHNYYEVSLLKKRKGILEIINSEPYKSALENVNVDLLTKKQKTITKFFRHNLIISFYFVNKLHNLYLNLNNKKY